MPAYARDLIRLNPIFYAIDGVRYGFSGTAQAPLATGVLMLAGTNLALGFAVLSLFRRGWRLKA
jgi:ABC-2 type transport system permease protein